MQREGESDADYAAEPRRRWKRLVERCADRVIAFVAETVVGATAGAVPPVGDYFERIRHDLRPLWCTAHSRRGDVWHGPHRDAACLRTGSACARSDGGRQGPRRRLSADSARYAGGADLPSVREWLGAFQHGHTYMGHPMAAAAALAVQDVIRRDHLLANVVETGARLERGLKERFGQHPFVGDIRGRGLFWALELVGDRASKRPFDPTAKVHARVKREAMARADRSTRWAGRSMASTAIMSSCPSLHRPGKPSRRDRRAPRRSARGGARRCPVIP